MASRHHGGSGKKSAKKLYFRPPLAARVVLYLGAIVAVGLIVGQTIGADFALSPEEIGQLQSR
jgi:hypothetical protein